MAISSRQAGAVVHCPTCGEQTLVPLVDAFSFDTAPPTQTQPEIDPPVSENQTESEILQPNLEEDFAPEQTLQIEIVPLETMHEIETEQRNAEENEELFVPGDTSEEDDDDTPLTIRRHNHLDDEMDLTPMVDVTFQLLIFFMVSASFSLQKSIEVPTPDPDQKGASQQVQTIEDLHGTSIIVKIDANNTIWIDDEPLGDVNRLADMLRDKMRREQKTELLVTADNQSLHRTIIAVIDAANEVGMQKIRMTSKKKMD
jgi:biopolymer transport protein ExbD